MTKTKILIFSLVLGILLLAGTITPIVMVLMPKSSGFKTGTNDTDTVTVPELINSSGNVINENWQTLLKYLSGTTDLSNVTTDTKTATDIRGFTYNGKTSSKSLLVTLGGIKWIAVYLSTNTSGDKILTLWQADATEAAQWNEAYQNSTSGSYRSNLYGTSKIRSVTLGNGGPYYNTNNSKALKENNNKTGTYAQFTNGVYTKYLEQPQNMSWQVSGTSAKATVGLSYNYNNDNLSNDGLSNFGNYNYNSLDYYAAWGSDYVWLPSIAETGYKGNTTNAGLWKVNNNERSTTIISGTTNNYGYCWLRSTTYNYTYDVCVLDPAGNNYKYNNVSNTYAVRPALHLNLTVTETILNSAFFTYNNQGGQGGPSEGNVQVHVNEPMPQIIAPYKLGYKFGGYFTEPNGLGLQYYTSTGASARDCDETLAGNTTTLYAYWVPDIDNRIFVSTVGIKDYGLVALGSARVLGYGTFNNLDYVHIDATPCKGYKFVGWLINGQLSTTYTESAENIPLTDIQDHFITALFASLNDTLCIVTFAEAYGISASPQMLASGDKVTEPATPTREGYTFDGWYNGNTLWDFSTNTVTSNLTLTAHWTEIVIIQTYTVTVDYRSNSIVTSGNYIWIGTDTTVKSAVFNEGDTVTIAAESYVSSDNYFDRWYDASTGGTIISTSTSYTFTVTGDVTYYAYFYHVSCCVSGDTLITMADGSTKRADEVQEGEYVLTYDTGSGKLEASKVLATIVRHKFEKVTINFIDGTQIQVTIDHILYAKNKNGEIGWEGYDVNAGYNTYGDEIDHLSKFEVGDSMFTISNYSTNDLTNIQTGFDKEIKSIEYEYNQEGYNFYTFTIENNHNYFSNDILSHNGSCGP